MNLILFESGEIERGLDPADDRAVHIVEILRSHQGDTIKVGEIEGLTGTAVYEGTRDGRLRFQSWKFDRPAALPYPIDLVIGTPRPPTARRLLKDLTTLGARSIHFAATDLGEKSYLQSNLWTNDARRAVLEGAQQTLTTHLPEIVRHTSLEKALYALETAQPQASRLWFDFGSPALLDRPNPSEGSIALAVGPERGWSERERAIFRHHGWEPRSLGTRILRTETACLVSLSMCAQKWFA